MLTSAPACLHFDAPKIQPVIPCLPPACLQLKAAVQALTGERDELQRLVQQAAAEMQAVQQQLADSCSQQVGSSGLQAGRGAEWATTNAQTCAQLHSTEACNIFAKPCACTL